MSINRKNNSGYLLLEIMVAVAMITMDLVAIVSTNRTSLRNSDVSKNQSVGTRYAQEGVEGVRRIRDQHGWRPFVNALNTIDSAPPPTSNNFWICLGTIPDYDDFLTSNSIDEADINTCTLDADDNFIRAANFVRDTATPDRVTITVVVSSNQGGRENRTQIETRLGDWN